MDPAVATGSWQVEHNLAEGEELELMRKAKRYQLDIVGLTSTQCLLWNRTLIGIGPSLTQELHSVRGARPRPRSLSRWRKGSPECELKSQGEQL